MKFTPLPLETVAASGFTHKITLTHADLVGASTTCVVRLLPADSGNMPAGWVFTKAGFRLVTPFDSSGDATINSLIVKIGMSGDDDCLLAFATAQLAADGSYYNYYEEKVDTASVDTPYPLNNPAYVIATFTVAGGASPTIDELDSGEVELLLGAYNMAQLAND